MYELKYVSPWPAAKFAGIIMAIISVVPLIFGVIAFLVDTGGYSYIDSGDTWFLLLWLVFPILAGVVYFLLTALIIWLYNVLRGRIGGVKLELEYLDEGSQQ